MSARDATQDQPRRTLELPQHAPSALPETAPRPPSALPETKELNSAAVPPGAASSAGSSRQPGPAPRLQFTQLVVRGNYSKRRLLEILQGRAPKFKECYAQYLTAHPGQEGTVSVSFEMSGGMASRIVDSGSSIQDPTLSHCFFGVVAGEAFIPKVFVGYVGLGFTAQLVPQENAE